MSSFLDFQVLNGATVSPALIHNVYTGPVPTNLESQGEEWEKLMLLSTNFLLLSIFMCVYVCVCVVSVADSHDLQVSLSTGHRSIFFLLCGI